MNVYEFPYNENRPVVCMDEKADQFLLRPGTAADDSGSGPEKQDSEICPVNGNGQYICLIRTLGGAHHVSVRNTYSL